MNVVHLVGRIANDIKIHGTGGNTFAPITVCVDGYWDKRQKQMIPYFIEVKLFGAIAERCRNLQKGSSVAVTGYIRPYVREKNGKKEYLQDIIVESIEFLSKPKNSGNGNHGGMERGDYRW